jgi:FG-GAP repeat
MRQIAVVLVLLLGATVWRAAGGLAAAPAITPAAAVEGLQADFNNDGFADLAVGVAGENLGAISNGGAVSVLYGSASGLSGAGSQLFTQDSPGVPDSVEFDDFLGEALAASGS